MIKIAIIGRKKDTINYERFLERLPAEPVTTLSPGVLPSCAAVVLPGGGDITPAFFGERNTGSRSIDVELDILQFQALDYAVRSGLPVMGICKGIQVINVAFGGTVTQDLPTASLHRRADGDLYHDTVIAPDSFLAKLYGERLTVNSAHHQGIGVLGQKLIPVQHHPEDHCVEALIHETLPVFGLQWHPERLDPAAAHADGLPLLRFFSSLISA